MKKKYKLHHCERVQDDLYRYAVVGGWLYTIDQSYTHSARAALQFVPDPNVEIA